MWIRLLGGADPRSACPFGEDAVNDGKFLLVRHERGFEKIRNYIERDPVRAGLATAAREYRWSSAGWPTGASAADLGVRPTDARRYEQQAGVPGAVYTVLTGR